jgi:hypothetical protein
MTDATQIYATAVWSGITFLYGVAWVSRNDWFLKLALIGTLLMIFHHTSGCASNPYGALSQGDTGACAVYAVAQASIRSGEIITNQEIVSLYRRVSRGGMGAYMIDVLPAAVDAGWMDGYEEIFGIDNMIRTAETGDLLLGIPAFKSSKPFSTQYWAVKGRYMGRHAILCTGYRGGLFTLLNSYGPAFGSNGRVWLWETDLELMLQVGTARAWTIK